MPLLQARGLVEKSGLARDASYDDTQLEEEDVDEILRSFEAQMSVSSPTSCEQEEVPPSQPRPESLENSPKSCEIQELANCNVSSDATQETSKPASHDQQELQTQQHAINPTSRELQVLQTQQATNPTGHESQALQTQQATNPTGHESQALQTQQATNPAGQQIHALQTQQALQSTQADTGGAQDSQAQQTPVVPEPDAVAKWLMSVIPGMAMQTGQASAVEQALKRPETIDFEQLLKRLQTMQPGPSSQPTSQPTSPRSMECPSAKDDVPGATLPPPASLNAQPSQAGGAALPAAMDESKVEPAPTPAAIAKNLEPEPARAEKAEVAAEAQTEHVSCKPSWL